jgi:uncharacterized membrane protein
MSYIMKREADTYYFKGLRNTVVRSFYTVTSVILFLMTGALEINYQFSHRLAGLGLEYIYLQMYLAAFYLLLLFVLKRISVIVTSYIRLAVPLLLFIFYLFNIENCYNTEKLLLTTGNMKIHFIVHWLSIVLFLAIFWNIIQYVKTNSKNFKEILNGFSWIIVAAIVVLFSFEIMHLYIWLTYKNPTSITYSENLYSKAGLSIVWGISSFILIWSGMRYSFKPLRIIALVLFGITLIKLFVFDIRNIPPAGKILAFILLGVLLLIVSFMYQRLKKLIIDDASKK